MNLKKIWRQMMAPKIFNRGYLPEAGGHQVYFVEMGNPRGVPGAGVSRRAGRRHESALCAAV